MQPLDPIRPLSHNHPDAECAVEAEPPISEQDERYSTVVVDVADGSFAAMKRKRNQQAPQTICEFWDSQEDGWW